MEYANIYTEKYIETGGFHKSSLKDLNKLFKSFNDINITVSNIEVLKKVKNPLFEEYISIIKGMEDVYGDDTDIIFEFVEGCNFNSEDQKALVELVSSKLGSNLLKDIIIFTNSNMLSFFDRDWIKRINNNKFDFVNKEEEYKMDTEFKNITTEDLNILDKKRNVSEDNFKSGSGKFKRDLRDDSELTAENQLLNILMIYNISRDKAYEYANAYAKLLVKTNGFQNKSLKDLNILFKMSNNTDSNLSYNEKLKNIKDIYDNIYGDDNKMIDDFVEGFDFNDEDQKALVELVSSELGSNLLKDIIIFTNNNQNK